MFLILLLLLSLFPLRLDDCSGDTVEIPLTVLADAAAAVVGLLEDTDLLERLEDLAVNGSGGVDVVGGARATVLGGAVNLPQTANTNGLAHVDVAGNGSGADVVPAIISR